MDESGEVAGETGEVMTSERPSGMEEGVVAVGREEADNDASAGGTVLPGREAEVPSLAHGSFNTGSEEEEAAWVSLDVSGDDSAALEFELEGHRLILRAFRTAEPRALRAAELRALRTADSEARGIID